MQIECRQRVVFVCSNQSFTSLACQVEYAIALRLEHVLAAAAVREYPQVRSTDLSLQVNDTGKVQGCRQSYALASYVYFTRVQVGTPPDNLIITDKGWCHGLPLQASIMCWPWNFGAVAPPMVALRASHRIEKPKNWQAIIPSKEPKTGGRTLESVAVRVFPSS